MHEQVLNKVSARFRDVGMKTAKNIPSPILVYALEGAEPASRGRGRSNLRIRHRPLAAFAFMAAIAMASGASLAIAGRWPILTWARGSAAGSARASAGSGNYGVVSPAARSVLAPTLHPFDVKTTPFVSDSDRLRIAGVLSSHGRNHALALSRAGGYGLSSSRSTPDEAREAAMELCAVLGRGECGLYEVNGDVVWPRAIPMPPKPWIDPSVTHTPFGSARLVGLTEEERKHVVDSFSIDRCARALALGPAGSWYNRVELSNDEEAARAALEFCGDRQGVACRVVAIDDQFVVRETTEAVDAVLDVVDRCDQLAGAPFDAGLSNGRVSFGSLDAKSAVPICWEALEAHLSDASLQLSLGRAMEKSGLFPEKAFELYRTSAAAGDAAALNALGTAYDTGKFGLARDPTMAASFYSKSADAGNPDAMRNLALLYSAGAGVGARDEERAASLIAKADHAEVTWTPLSR